MSYIHPLADVAECEIGQGTKVWQFVVVLKGAKIGKECNICAQTLIEGDVVIGDRVTVKSGVQIWDGSVIGNDVFIGPNATFSNDLYPKSRQYPIQFHGITIHDGASIGANATLLPGITVGEKAMVGAGTVVTKDVPARAVVLGNPAKIVRFFDDPIS
jgi:UDP-2-acetamido-3-amino-2,3-dideoxy-glucuronate N-acetyltransferase